MMDWLIVRFVLGLVCIFVGFACMCHSEFRSRPSNLQMFAGSVALFVGLILGLTLR